jgi:predicted glycosyltransferase
MKILFYFAHPAQYLFARNTINELMRNNHQVKIVIKTKDVLETLLKNDGFEYENILPSERGNSKLAIAWSLIKRNITLLPIILKFKPNLLIGTDASIAQIGKLLRIDRITILEDDYNIIKSLADITYPFTQTIFCPTVCDVGKLDTKKIGYEGYMKLGYLHPNVFHFNQGIVDKYQVKEKYAIIRLAKLTAHHDFGIKGIDTELLDKLIDILEKESFQVLLSTEDVIDEKYQSYILKINPNDIHHLLAKASLLICDSQSMSVEASMLGIPSLRVSSFAGKISVLEELEKKYQLTFGIHPNNIEVLFEKLEELLSFKNLKKKFKKRREAMLEDKIDVSSFFTWFIENYPKSIKIVKDDPNYPKRFK